MGKVPSVWLLWQLLGNNFSDKGRYGDAVEAYERALDCPGVETLSVHYNIATVLTRQERLEDALSHLDLGHVTTDDANRKLSLLVASQRINVLTRLGRHEEALTEGQTLITREHAEGTEDELLAPVLGEYASALLSGAGNREGAEDAAWHAIRLDKFDHSAMWVLRELNARASADGSLYRLMLVGRWYQPLDDDPELPGFFTTYEVVADSSDEALELTRRFEPPGVQQTVRAEESEVLEARPNEPKGVYSASGYNFFPGHELKETGAS